MNPASLPDLQALFKAFDLPEPVQGKLIATPLSDVLRKPADAAAQLQNFCAEHPQATGWLCTADRVQLFPPLDGTEIAFDDSDPLLSAELCENDTSLHIRQTETGYVAVKIKRNDNQTNACITEQQFLCADKRLGTQVTYEVCWELDNTLSPPALRPILSRFAGFSSRKE